jgi:hypothetical protein
MNGKSRRCFDFSRTAYRGWLKSCDARRASGRETDSDKSEKKFSNPALRRDETKKFVLARRRGPRNTSS